eukprot:TRINITY_DN55995_c0_g1_i1.p1 TRINITY_DN55995_c0_g1~~TRINITY_DN55995_c0_g1_i1.p1  ORF type:complete len:206 (+),score=13.87 TRINITY_DN55995_c0_g1_i1:80-697(+)
MFKLHRCSEVVVIWVLCVLFEPTCALIGATSNMSTLSGNEQSRGCLYRNNHQASVNSSLRGSAQKLGIPWLHPELVGDRKLGDVDNEGFFKALEQNNVFLSVYTTWCPDCALWLRQDGPWEEVSSQIERSGLKDHITVLTLNIERDTVDEDALRQFGLDSFWVPALYTVKKGLASTPSQYSGTSHDYPQSIFAWIQTSLNLKEQR